MEPKEESASIGKVKGSSGAKSSWRSAMANHKSSSRSHVRGLKDGISCDSCSWGCNPSKQPDQGVPLNHSQWWIEVLSWRRRKSNLDRLHRWIICTWLWGKPWLLRCPFGLFFSFLEVWPTRFCDIIYGWSCTHWDHRGHGGWWQHPCDLTRTFSWRSKGPADGQHACFVNPDRWRWQLAHTSLASSSCVCNTVSVCGWMALQHVPGEFMVADIGTKPLTAARFEFLKLCMGMGKLESEVEVEEGKERKKGEKKEEKKDQDGQLANKEKKRLAETTQVLRLITLAVSIAVTKAVEEKEAEEALPFEVTLIYTLVIIIFTLASCDSVLWLKKSPHERCEERKEGGLPRRSAWLFVKADLEWCCPSSPRCSASSTRCSASSSRCSASSSRCSAASWVNQCGSATRRRTIIKPTNSSWSPNSGGTPTSAWCINSGLRKGVEWDRSRRTKGAHRARSSSSWRSFARACGFVTTAIFSPWDSLRHDHNTLLHPVPFQPKLEVFDCTYDWSCKKS